MNKYKKIIVLLAAVLFASLQAFSQNSPVDRFFEQYANDGRFTFVDINPQQMSQINDAAGDINVNIATDISAVRILKTKVTPDQFFQEAVNRLDAPPFVEISSVQKPDKIVKYLARKNKHGEIVETVMMISKPDKFVLMDVMGNNLDLNVNGGIRLWLGLGL